MSSINISQDQNWKLLQYFNIYRVALATMAAGVAVIAGSVSSFGSADPNLFLYSSITYLVIGLFGLKITQTRQPDFETQASVFFFGDVTFITLLMHASGGISSGLGLFLIIAIAGCSLMLGKKMTVFFAALASIAALIQHGWGWLTGAVPIEAITEDFPQVGILGIGLFATAALGRAIANRVHSSEALAERRGIDLANLTQLNELVIQRMQSGVLVCDVNGNISLSNNQAQHFLNLSPANTAIGDVSSELAESLNEWLEYPERHLQRPFRTRIGHTLLPRFELLGKSPEAGILIFLDDAAILKQQAQQLKMAALARLTASIAHEIRNPLGAISNAAQLLAETAPPESQDSRLIEIISDHTRRMNTIIENITQLARRDRVSLVQLALHPWLLELRDQYVSQVQLPVRAISITGDKQLMACIDPDQLYQIVINLCQNALRYCPSFTDEPLIQLELGYTEDNYPRLDVMDTGTGVPPGIIENIFDPFFTTSASGTGLGLYISRELCEGNGGRLDYVPEKAVGACFRITFASSSECGTSL
ncbi:MAG: HAMP domain-containing histidine kinase [Gammaproteobacteria bacterium]|nr:HAMP domain-containing histidine kinase [Gammaproteobacteria bacterium]